MCIRDSHRDSSPRVRKQPFDVTPARETARQKQACHRACGVVRDLDHCWEGTNAEIAAASRYQWMHVNHSLATIEFIENRLVHRMTEPLVAVISLRRQVARSCDVQADFR